MVSIPTCYDIQFHLANLDKNAPYSCPLIFPRYIVDRRITTSNISWQEYVPHCSFIFPCNVSTPTYHDVQRIVTTVYAFFALLPFQSVGLIICQIPLDNNVPYYSPSFPAPLYWFIYDTFLMQTIFFSPIVRCNFDQGVLCSFTNGANDDFDWTVHSGSTSSLNTGPSQDVSGNGNTPIVSYYLNYWIKCHIG
jgi:hypothetical protein